MKRFALKTYSLFLLFCSYAICDYASEPFRFSSEGPVKSKLLRTRIMVAPVISFYKVNKNHASGVSQKMSGLFSIKEEFRLNASHTVFFSIGAEYFVHGLKFFSYYFNPDSLQLYDGEMNYSYNLYVHELDIPLQMKISFTKENNSKFSPYVVFGYHLRTLLFGGLKVKRDGEAVVSKKENVIFKNPLISNKCNPFLSVAIGIQANRPNTKKIGLFGEIGFRFGISPYLLKDTFTPSSLYISGNHLSIGVGMRF